jgi:cytochrome P450
MIEILISSDNLPADRIVAYDYTADPDIAEDPRAHAMQLHGMPGLVYTPAYGGHWIATKAAIIDEILTNPELFSSYPLTIPKVLTEGKPQTLGEYDPPEHGKYRALMQPLVNPRLIQGFEADVRKLMIELTENIRPLGRCEFHDDIASKLPVLIIMELLGLPIEDSAVLMDWTDKLIGHPDTAVRLDARERMIAYVRADMAKCRATPERSDLVSTILAAEIDGQPITDDNAGALIQTLVFGGLDTVRSSMAFFAHFLATHDEHRRQLVQSPDLIPNAVDELTRWFSLPSLSRCVTRDVEFHGVNLKQGEQVLTPLVLGSCDEALHSKALEVDFMRKNPKHYAFGAGPHFCPGRPIARMELSIFLEEWLKRIPEFRIVPGTAPIGSGGVVAGLRKVYLEWPVS